MERAIRLNENYVHALELIEDNNIIQGIRELELLLLYSSEDTDILNLLALCNLQYCNFKKAREYIDKSFKIKNTIKGVEYKKIIDDMFKKGHANKYYGIIRQVKAGKYITAINELEDFKLVDAKFIEPYILLGMLYYKNNNYLKARMNIGKAYKLDRSNEVINRLYIKLKI